MIETRNDVLQRLGNDESDVTVIREAMIGIDEDDYTLIQLDRVDSRDAHGNVEPVDYGVRFEAARSVGIAMIRPEQIPDLIEVLTGMYDTWRANGATEWQGCDASNTGVVVL